MMVLYTCVTHGEHAPPSLSFPFRSPSVLASPDYYYIGRLCLPSPPAIFFFLAQQDVVTVYPFSLFLKV